MLRSLIRADSVLPSSASNLRKAGVATGAGSAPRPLNRSLSAGAPRALVNSRERRSVTSAGRLFGAQTPNQMSRLGVLDAEVRVGGCVREERRLAVAGHAQELDLAGLDVREGDARIEHEVGLAGHHVLQGGAEPRYGTWVTKVPVLCLNSSPARCGGVAVPEEA